MLLASVLLGSCIEAPPTGGVEISRRTVADDAHTWVLFVGNSHTYINDVPRMVRRVAEQAGNFSIRADMVAFPDFSLQDHWYQGAARSALARYRWDYVVMQQGPSAQGENPLHLQHWSQEFEPLVRAAGGEPVLYQVWPSVGRRVDADEALSAYTNAAAVVEGILAPAGDAFTATLGVDPTAAVYSNDGLHASKIGSYLAALTIVARLLDIDPRTLPDVIPGSSTPASVVAFLQESAATALDRNAARP